ncbi:MAG: DUF1559 domain-containing protein [Planctomycetaceae bacterium]|nr:DUF1559 domain-containing protein [Planctomycetaceae bacterium]
MKRSPQCGAIRTHDGFSLIEVLISIAVIGLLLGLLLPAVQQSRATSRRIDCANRLKQIALATANFEATHRLYPDSYKWRVQLLEHLGERALAGQFARTEDWAAGNADQAPETWRLQTPLSQFICPAETDSSGQPIVNYYANMGSGLQAHGFNGFLSPENGGAYYYGAHNVRHLSGRTKPADFQDGLSNTVAYSEALASPSTFVGSVGATGASREQIFRLSWGVDGELSTADDLPEFARLCRSVVSWNAFSIGSNRGRMCWPEWRSGAVYVGPIIHGWAYDHVLPPNSPSCGNSYWGIYSANSLHVAGVNVVFGDGHGKFIAEAIDKSLWTALGTRSGNETVEF